MSPEELRQQEVDELLHFAAADGDVDMLQDALARVRSSLPRQCARRRRRARAPVRPDARPAAAGRGRALARPQRLQPDGAARGEPVRGRAHIYGARAARGGRGRERALVRELDRPARGCVLGARGAARRRCTPQTSARARAAERGGRRARGGAGQDVVRLLLDSGADAFAVNSMGNTPLLQAEGNWRAVGPRPLRRSADAAHICFADGALLLRRRFRDRRR
jgi:hypothetical protein